MIGMIFFIFFRVFRCSLLFVVVLGNKVACQTGHQGQYNGEHCCVELLGEPRKAYQNHGKKGHCDVQHYAVAFAQAEQYVKKQRIEPQYVEIPFGAPVYGEEPHHQQN